MNRKRKHDFYRKHGSSLKHIKLGWNEYNIQETQKE